MTVYAICRIFAQVSVCKIQKRYTLICLNVYFLRRFFSLAMNC